jgi:very-short-patch-repair endonuclease
MRTDEMLALAARQHGLAHRKQLTALGYTPSAIRRQVESGRLRWRTSRVVELVGAPDTREQRLMAGLLDLSTEAALSYHTSAARWGLPGFALHPIHVTGRRERGRRPQQIAIVHRPRLLLPDHVVMLDGLPTTTPARTLFDLAGVIHPLRTERALENALLDRLTTVARLQAMLRQLARRGRPGIGVMRSLLDALPPDYMPTGSRLERRVEDLARRIGITTLVRQLDVGGDDDWLGRVDFVDRVRRVIIEVQSERFHNGRLDRAADARRIAALRAAGWIVIEILEHDVWYDADKVVHQMREAFWQAQSAC